VVLAPPGAAPATGPLARRNSPDAVVSKDNEQPSNLFVASGKARLA
jgi:hypothetical protein